MRPGYAERYSLGCAARFVWDTSCLRATAIGRRRQRVCGSIQRAPFLDTRPGELAASPAAAAAVINNLVDAMKLQHRTKPLYPPILAGDFNMGVDIPGFARFDVARWSFDGDVIGVVVGKAGDFSSSFPAHVVETRVLPGTGCENEGGSTATLWSDHCAVYVRFEPYPR